MARKVKRYTQEEKEKYIKDYKESKLSWIGYTKLDKKDKDMLK